MVIKYFSETGVSKSIFIKYTKDVVLFVDLSLSDELWNASHSSRTHFIQYLGSQSGVDMTNALVIEGKLPSKMKGNGIFDGHIVYNTTRDNPFKDEWHQIYLEDEVLETLLEISSVDELNFVAPKMFVKQDI